MQNRNAQENGNVAADARTARWIPRALAGLASTALVAGVLALAGSGIATRSGAAPQPAPQAPSGKAIFENNCVACHGDDGSGSDTGKALNAPDLRSPEVQKLPDADLKKVVSDGKNNMPPFKSTLKPEEISAAIAYIRTLAHKK